MTDEERSALVAKIRRLAADNGASLREAVRVAQLAGLMELDHTTAEEIIASASEGGSVHH